MVTPTRTMQQSNQHVDPPLFPDWMSQLPPQLHSAPLNSLAIPGLCQQLYSFQIGLTRTEIKLYKIRMGDNRAFINFCCH